jgi:DNA polymerase-1
MKNLLKNIPNNSIISTDLETVEDIDIDLFSIGIKIRDDYFAESYEPTQENLELYYKLLYSTNIIVFHNAAYDLKILRKNDFDIVKIRNKVHDTMLMAHLIDENRRSGLKVRCEDVGMRLEEWKDIDKEDRVKYKEYAKDDSLATIKLFYKYGPVLKSEKLLTTYELERELIYVTIEMEKNGMLIDAEASKRMFDIATKEIKKIEVKIHTLNDGIFNLGSTQQLATFLFRKMGIKLNRRWVTEKNNISTNEKVLSEIVERDAGTKGEEVVRDLLEHRRLKKLTTTYLGEAILKFTDNTGRIHPSFDQIGTVGARYATRKPSVQNIATDPVIKGGEKVRSQFIPTPGWYMVVGDYSQIELRIAALLTQDSVMLDVYKRGGDLHQETADNIGCDRKFAKIINFGINYCMSPQAFAYKVKCSLREAQKYFEEHSKRFATLHTEKHRVEGFTKEYGYARTFSGRKRRLPKIHSKNFGEMNGALRQAFNSVIQSAAGELIKLAMIEIYEKLPRDEVKIINQVHDELIFEIKKKKYLKDIKYIMENAITFNEIKFEADIKIVNNWSEK